MRLLLDTRAVLWWLMDDPHLSPGARTAIADPANQLLVSAAIGYELDLQATAGSAARRARKPFSPAPEGTH
jgi:PIN domain nuclease of toxin-antitoxin system